MITARITHISEDYGTLTVSNGVNEVDITVSQFIVDQVLTMESMEATDGHTDTTE